MASHPPARCCTIGVKHEGEATGEIKTISGKNKQTELAILILPDVIGHEFINAQLLADHFAANGYFVVMPDLFEGDPIPLNRPEGFDLGKWLTTGGPNNGHTFKQVDPIVETIIKEMRSNLGVKKIGSVGYCFGAKYVARFSAEGKGIDVAAMAHPSFVDAEEIKAMKAPLTIAAAETDEIFPAAKRRETEDILKDMSIPYQINLYSDVVHGFSVRGDMSNKRAKYAKEAAFLQHVQCAIVTGGSRGIGEAIAFDLASRGAKVVLTYSSDRSKKSADALVQRIKTEADSSAIDVQCDLKDPKAAQQIVDATLEAFGDHIDILVNNAAIISDKFVGDITAEHFDDVFQTNVRAPLFMLQAILPRLRRPGRIINISSVGARQGYPGTGVYCASKAALEGFTRNWAAELGKDGTTVNAVNPGPVRSEMLDQVDPKIVEPQLKATVVEQRAGKPEEIAEIVAFLAEPRSSWVSGQCISSSGGFNFY
nr:hydrolase tropi [Quercus suber]